MNHKGKKYYDFLDDLSNRNDMSPAFFEAVKKGFNKIFDVLNESTEEKVKELKEKFPKKPEEDTPTEEFIEELKKESPPDEEIM